jgi:hypothetical protein
MISDEFVPPKPKEFDRKALISQGVVLVAMLSLAVTSSGFSRLIFGAAKPFVIMMVE